MTCKSFYEHTARKKKQKKEKWHSKHAVLSQKKE